MKTKRLVIFGVSIALFIAVIAAAVNAVFTVSSVEVRFQTFSERGKEEAAVLQTQLDQTFLGRSTTFLNVNDVQTEVGKFPCFRVKTLEKQFPRSVVISLEEREETFAYHRENGGYAIFDSEGVYLYDREENVNRLGGENILVEGFSLTIPTSGNTVTGDGFSALLQLTDTFRYRLGTVRANVRSVEFFERKNEGTYFRIRMQEGVILEIHLPQQNMQEKAEAMIEAYEELSETQKTYGYLDIIDLGDGKFHKPHHRDEIYVKND